VRRVHHSVASCASANGATSRCGRAAHRVRACCRRNSGPVLGAAGRLNSPETLRPLVPPLAATDFLHRKFPVSTVVADGRVYTIEEFGKQWWTRRPRSSALVPRDTPGIRLRRRRDVNFVLAVVLQYQSHVELFEAISANARTRHPRSTHSHDASCLAGENGSKISVSLSSGMPEPSLATLNYHQTLLNKQVELKVGHLVNLVEYWGPYRAGNLSSRIFGPSGSIPIAASRLFGHRNSAAPGRRLKCLMVTLSLLKIRQ
jgi:hypothetical protein